MAHKNGYVPLHILVFEEANSCCVLPWCDVHHVDRNTMNNRPENLVGMMESQHMSLHHRGKTVPEELRKMLSETRKGSHYSPRTEFKKGLTPWNKGKKGIQVAWNKDKKMSEETRAKSAKTWFKKGHKMVPWNKGKKKNH